MSNTYVHPWEAREQSGAIKDVTDELILATVKHGPFNSAHEGYAVILEELDELKEEVWKRKRDKARMREEAMQVAAMAIRFMLDVCGGL